VTGASFHGCGRPRPDQDRAVFLDEVGELELSLQSHLLRVLESRSIQRLGSAKEIPVDFRLVSATHRELKSWVQDGRFLIPVVHPSNSERTDNSNSNGNRRQAVAQVKNNV
jgi:Nif-specific regulatory protein